MLLLLLLYLYDYYYYYYLLLFSIITFITTLILDIIFMKTAESCPHYLGRQRCNG